MSPALSCLQRVRGAKIKLISLTATRAGRYAIGQLMFAVALWTRLALNDILPAGFPYLTFFPAVIVTTFVAGLGPGIMTAVCCGIASWYFFIPPFNSFFLDGASALALAFYAAIVAVDIALIHYMQIALGRLRAEKARTAALLDAQITMFHELQHRVANNMQFVSALLSMHRRAISDSPEAARSALDEAGSRLETMARVHRRLYDPQAAVGFDLHIEALCRDVLEASGAQNVVCLVTVQDPPHSPDRLLAIALLIVEVLTNSLKHAFGDREGGTVRIHLAPIENGARMKLRITDDGRGMPVYFDADRLTSLGWKIIQNLTGQLGGNLSVESAGGTQIEVLFPA